MLIGSGNQPYPRDCPQDCQFGPLFQHGRLNYTALRKVNTTTVSQWPDGTVMLNAPQPPAESYAFRIPMVGHCEPGPDDLMPGPWISGGQYNFTLLPGQPATAPGQTFTNPKMLTAVAVAAGGSGYVAADVGKVLAISGGKVTPGNSMSYIKIAKVVAGAVTAALIVQRGSYLTNPASPNATLGGATGAGATFTLTFANETTNFSKCEKTGFKNLAALRQWHGTFGFLSHDPAGSSKSLCPTPIADLNGNPPFSKASDPGQGGYPGSPPCDWVPTYSLPGYEPPQAAADQTKYLTVTYGISYYNAATGNKYNDWDTSWASGSISVDPDSGEITNSVVSHEDQYTQAVTNPGDPVAPVLLRKSIHGGVGFNGSYDWNGSGWVIGSIVRYLSGGTTAADDYITDYHFGNDPAKAWVDAWNGNLVGQDQYLPVVMDLNNYSGSATTGNPTRGYISTTVSWQRTDTTYTFSVTQHTQNYDNTIVTDLVITGFIALSNPNPASSVLASVYGLLDTVPLNDDKLYPWRMDSLCQTAPLLSRNEKALNATPFAGFLPATVNDLRVIIPDAYGNAPWTTNDPAAVAPWIYNAANTAPYQVTYAQMPWFDQTCYAWLMDPTSGGLRATDLRKLIDGQILGQPLAAGNENFFCWQFQDWQGCIDDYTDSFGDHHVLFDFYLYGFGMTVAQYNGETGAQLPLNATQWTQNNESITTPIGASLMYADPTQNGQHHQEGVMLAARHADALWAYKYAVIKENWQGQNYARPGGADQFLYDETQVYAVTSNGTGGWTLTTLDATSPPTLDLSGIWGGAVVGGFYDGNSYSVDPGTGIGTVTLGWLALNLPANWTSRSGDGSVCFGKLRFPTAPSLLGRVRITTTGISAAFDAPEYTFGMSTLGPETVDLFDKDMTLLAASVSAYREDDSNFTLPAAYPTAVWVMIHGSPNWYVDTNYPRGNALALEWLFDRRTNGESGRLGTGTLDCNGNPVTVAANTGYSNWSQTELCLPFDACAPRVLCFSPNGETWDNGITLPFPTAFTLDERYSSRWQGMFQTTMTELFWQAPHHPLADMPDESLGAWPGDTTPAASVHWNMDDGTCKEDGFVVTNPETGDGYMQKWYPLAPMVEAELQTPKYGYNHPQTEAPPPPPFQLGWLSPVTNTSGEVSVPPGVTFWDNGPGGFTPDGMPNPWLTEWGTRALLVAAIAWDSSCRFKADYQDWMI